MIDMHRRGITSRLIWPATYDIETVCCCFAGAEIPENIAAQSLVPNRFGDAVRPALGSAVFLAAVEAMLQLHER